MFTWFFGALLELCVRKFPAKPKKENLDTYRLPHIIITYLMPKSEKGYT